MGHARLTVRNLTIIGTDKENNLLLIRGAVPGPQGSYVLIRKEKFGTK
jgi:large subunit ribosomal protein L3